MRQKVTIEDISRETGLSRGTISRALNDRPDISAATKVRVVQACQKLNYAPNHAARALATGRTFAITAFVRDLCDPYAGAMLSGAVRRAEQSGYLIHPIELPASADDAASCIERTLGERIDGALLLTPVDRTTRDRMVEALAQKPLVQTCESAGAQDFVAPDWREAGRAGARFLASRGVRRVLLCGDSGRETAREGFLEIAELEGIRIETADAPRSAIAARHIGDRLASVDAVVALGVGCAHSVALAAAAAGRWPGEGVALLSIGDGPCAAHLTPSISAVDVDLAEIGRRAADVLLARLAVDAPGVAQVHVAPRIMERESTARLRR